MNTSNNNQFDTCIVTLVFILIICDHFVKVLTSFQHPNSALPNGLNRWVSIRTEQTIGGSNLAGDIHFSLECFVPLPFFTARRSPYK